VTRREEVNRLVEAHGFDAVRKEMNKIFRRDALLAAARRVGIIGVGAIHQRENGTLPAGEVSRIFPAQEGQGDNGEIRDTREERDSPESTPSRAVTLGQSLRSVPNFAERSDR
jgi:hypothetical protein